MLGNTDLRPFVARVVGADDPSGSPRVGFVMLSADGRSYAHSITPWAPISSW